MEWLAQSYRLTIINQNPFINDDLGWWEKIIKSKPDTITQHPEKFGIKKEGIFESNHLSLEVKPERIDWNYYIADDLSKGPSKTVQNLGLFNESITSFKNLINKWFKLDNLPTVGRVAFGAKLVIPVGDVLEGYSKLDHFLSNVNLNAKEPSDFMYQINKKRNSNAGIKDLRINRLTKWAVTKYRSFLISPADPGATFGHLDTFACTLDLDINTIPHKNEIPYNKLDDVFKELVNLGLEIAKKGDIA